MFLFHWYCSMRLIIFLIFFLSLMHRLDLWNKKYNTKFVQHSHPHMYCHLHKRKTKKLNLCYEVSRFFCACNFQILTFNTSFSLFEIFFTSISRLGQSSIFFWKYYFSTFLSFINNSIDSLSLALFSFPKVRSIFNFHRISYPSKIKISNPMLHWIQLTWISKCKHLQIKNRMSLNIKIQAFTS
jgi:hypothetical protein